MPTLSTGTNDRDIKPPKGGFLSRVFIPDWSLCFPGHFCVFVPGQILFYFCPTTRCVIQKTFKIILNIQFLKPQHQAKELPTK